MEGQEAHPRSACRCAMPTKRQERIWTPKTRNLNGTKRGVGEGEGEEGEEEGCSHGGKLSWARW